MSDAPTRPGDDQARRDWRAAMDKEFVGVWDLPEGRDLIVTITGASEEELTLPLGRKNHRLVLTLKGAKKRLVINSTNGNTIMGLYGRFYQDWIGKRIALYINPKVKQPTGGYGPGIGVRDEQPPAPKA